MQCAPGAGNGQHPRLCQQKGQQDLRRGGAVGKRNVLHGVVGKQPPPQPPRLRQRAVGHHRNFPLLQKRQEVILHAAAAQMVQHLIGGAGPAAGHRQQLLHVLRVQIADAPRPNQPLPLQFLHTFHRFGKGHAAPPV